MRDKAHKVNNKVILSLALNFMSTTDPFQLWQNLRAAMEASTLTDKHAAAATSAGGDVACKGEGKQL